MKRNMLHPIARVLMIGLLWLGLALSPVRADAGPDYSVLARLALPWACGQGHIVTWGPWEHWAQRKATGIAFDFAIPTGTPLYAPADGWACFLRDERPYDSTLGHYVELVIEKDWVVRLAHLRDAQSGERMVRAGELLGYAGSSGASAPHLHLEVLMREGAQWVRPDPARVERLFGFALSDLVEDAIIAHSDCPAHLVLEGPVRPMSMMARLGEPVELVVPLANHGLAPLTLDAVQLALRAPTGAALVAEARGQWTITGGSAYSITVQVQPNLAGEWRVTRATCQAASVAQGFSAEGQFRIAPASLRLVELAARAVLDVGERIVLDALVENTGPNDLALDDLHVRGAQPDGAPWFATAGHAGIIPAGGKARFTLHSATLPQRVGLWAATQIGYQRGQQIYYFDRCDRSFAVLGPELRIDRVAAYASSGMLNVFLTLTNIGTRPATPDAIEAWGWKPGGEQYFSLVNRRVPPIAPGRSALVQLSTALDGTEGLWRLVEAGQWVGGRYHRTALPEQPAFGVDRLTASPIHGQD